MLKPALRRGWRDRETVRFGVAPAHAKVVGPVDTATGSFLSLIDGTRTMQQLIEEAALLDIPPEHARGVVDRLGAAGLLEAPTAGGAAAEAVRADPAAFEQLRPDLASLSVRHPEPAGALGRIFRSSACSNRRSTGARRDVRAARRANARHDPRHRVDLPDTRRCGAAARGPANGARERHAERRELHRGPVDRHGDRDRSGRPRDLPGPPASGRSHECATRRGCRHHAAAETGDPHA